MHPVHDGLMRLLLLPEDMKMIAPKLKCSGSGMGTNTFVELAHCRTPKNSKP
jgi:hypothetical protein